MHHQIRLVDGEPIIFDEGTKCVIVGDNGRLQVRPTAEVDADRIVVHQAGGRPSLPFGLAHLSLGPHEATCFGVFRNFERPVFGEAMHAQLRSAEERLGKGDLDTLLHGGDTWTVELAPREPDCSTSRRRLEPGERVLGRARRPRGALPTRPGSTSSSASTSASVLLGPSPTRKLLTPGCPMCSSTGDASPGWPEQREPAAMWNPRSSSAIIERRARRGPRR